MDGPSLKRTPDFQRLCWQCRRGMLELDELLQGFMERRYAMLLPHHRQAFESLLRCPDQLLLEYLLGRAVPFDKDVAHVVSAIRDAVEP